MVLLILRWSFRTLALVFSVIGCSKSGSSSGVGNVSLAVKSASAASFMFTEGNSLIESSPYGILSAGDYGAASVGVGGLSSLKLYIRNIQLCQSMTISGSGYSGTSGCATVYTNPNDNDDYDSFTVTSAASAGAGKYIDLISASDRALLTSSSAIPAGSYSYGIISWYRPIKITGTVLLGNGASVSTKTCTSNDIHGACVLAGVASTTASESIYDSNNGGTWFKFLTPFTVTAGSTTAVDLAFDLDKKLFAGDSVSNGFGYQATGCSAVGSGYCGLYIPGIRLSPVPRLASETTKIESYIMGGASAQWNLRVDLYYNSADSSQAVLAADVNAIPTALTAGSLAAGIYLSTVTNDGGNTTFNNFDGVPQMSFTRGATGTATFLCPTGATLPGCVAGSNATLTWSSRSIQTLQN
jgi:hypothetical protein